MARSPFAEGILRALSLAPGIAPLGLVFGAFAQAAGFSVPAAAALSALIFAGGAQFAAVALVASGGALLSAVALVALVNSRYFLLSAAALDLGRISGARPWQRILLALGVVDESYALQAAWAKQRVVATAGLLAIPATLWVIWVASTITGALVGETLPELEPLGLDYALPGIFVGLLGIFADTRERLLAGLGALALGGGLALAGLSTVAVLVVPPLMAFGLGRWAPAR